MKLLNYLNPVEAFNSAKIIAKDISNYRFYRNKITDLEEKGFLKQWNMRADWIKRVYYVINLEPETLLATGDLADLEKSRVFDSVAKFQGKFADLNLTEIVDISTERIKDSEYYAYLIWVKCKFFSERSDFFRVIVFSIALYYAVNTGLWVYHNNADLQQWVMDKLTTK
jgi:hypothetical protein